nr:PREDICTED: uncharacterized protein LOC103363876 [Stegastes partitus]
MVSSFCTARYLYRHMKSMAQSSSKFTSPKIQSFYFSVWISFTAVSLYISGTTVNLGFGQAIFRQRAVNVWKAIKALFGVGMATNDVKLHSSQLTSVLFNTVANAAFIFCLVRPLHGEKIKQPLKLLLSSLSCNVNVIVTTILEVHLILCLCVLVMSNGATVVYLCRHMWRMVANGQPLSSSRFSSQVRVTITGILQGALSVFCAVWVVLSFFSDNGSSTSSKFCADLSFTNLYVSGTTLCLGTGQAVFRQRAAHIWTRAAQWCKAPQAHGSEHGA